MYSRMWSKNFECSAVLSGCEIEFTNYCGLDCRGCIRKDSSDFWFLDFETLQNICLYVATKKFTEIVISGLWDAFLHPKFYEFLEYIFERFPNIMVYVMTKWQSITDEDIEKFAIMKVQWKNINLTFSLFSLEKKQYKEVTWGWDLERLLWIIKLAHNKKINFSFEFFLDTGNIAYISQFQKFVSLFGKEFRYTIPHNWWGKLSSKIYKNLFDEKQLESIISVRKIWEICEAFEGEYVFFDFAGRVYKCWLGREWKDLFLGNINSGAFLREFSSLNYNSCKSCSYFSYKTKLW